MLYILSGCVGAFIMLVGVVMGALMTDFGKTTITAKKEANK